MNVCPGRAIERAWASQRSYKYRDQWLFHEEAVLKARRRKVKRGNRTEVKD